MATRLLITLCGPAGRLTFRDLALKTFCGKPLAHYALSAAEVFLRAPEQADVCADFALNTDSGLLRETVCGPYPEVVPLQRGAELNIEGVTRLDILRHTLLEMEACRGDAPPYDYLLDLDITSPLRCAADLAGCLATLQARPALDAVIGATAPRRNPFDDYAKRTGDRLERLVKPDEFAFGPLPAVYDLHAAVGCYRREWLARNASGLWWNAACEVYEMPDYGTAGTPPDEAFALLETLGRHLFQTKPEYKRVRDGIRR